LAGPELAIDSARDGVRARVRVDEVTPVETLSRHGDSYIWTAKQGGVRVSGLIELDGSPIQFDERGLVDHSAGYHARHTVWSWSAGVGVADDGRAVAWNLVTGVHDAPQASERTVWIDGEPREAGPAEFAADLSRVGELEFSEWGAREDSTNVLVLKSRYRQPFGTFTGTLPDGTVLREGYGVMESHDVHW
jgi:hypothetical protein